VALCTQATPHAPEPPPALQEKVFQKLFDTAEIAQFSPKDKQQYEQSLKYYRDLKNVIDSSFDEGIQEGMEKGRLEGRLEGREEGIQEGMEKGRLEGREEGKFEGKQESMLTIARNMKQAGEPLEKIALFTGLLTAEIAAL
jgi:predicted transposase YdaD